MHLCSVSSLSIPPLNRTGIFTVRALGSKDFGTLTSQEEKVKLGGSELKVSRLGIGAWSWGDNSYWNDFGWNGRFHELECGIIAFDIDSSFFFISCLMVYQILELLVSYNL